MNTKASLGLGSMTLLLSCALISASLMPFLGEQMNEESHNELIQYDEEDINALLNNTITELTTLLQIKNSYGAFNSTTQPAKIEKMAFYIKPFHNTPFNLSTLTLALHTQHDLYFFEPTQIVADSANTLFTNYIWSKTPPGYYSFMSLNDRDSSLKNHYLINSHTDTFYLLLTMPEELHLEKGNQFSILLLPSQGLQHRIDLEIPLPINQVVELTPC